MSPAEEANKQSSAVLASSLAEAQVGALIYTNSQGAVQPPSLYRWRMGIGIALYATLVATLVTLYIAMSHIAAGVVVGVAAFGSLGYRRAFATRLQEAVALIDQKRYEEARLQLTQLLEWRLFRRRHAPTLYLFLSAVERLQGHHTQALQLLHKALQGFSKSSHELYRQSALCSEVVLLCNVGQREQAAQRLHDLQPRLLPGDLIQFRYRLARLYVDLCQGLVSVEESVLWDYAQQGLQTTMGASLLALCAWAYQHSNPDLSTHLLTEALARQAQDPSFAEQTYPFLWEWVLSQKDKISHETTNRMLPTVIT